MNPIGLPATLDQSADTQYTMIFINNSNNAWNFCCYQQDPGILDQGAFSAAWFVAQVVHTTTNIKFQWTIDFGLSWSQSGVIKPGIVYFPGQNWLVTPAENTVTLTKQDGSYTFENQTQQDPTTAFNIVQDGTIVSPDGIGIGISMQITDAWGGKKGLNTLYAQSAQPNVTTQFTVTPKYYVVFAQDIQPSEILNVTNMTNTVEIPYDVGVYSMVVTLNAQNQWSVATTAAVDAEYLKAIQSEPHIAWNVVATSVARRI